jgi:hypothetical protein
MKKLHWWEEYLGIKVDVPTITKKVRWPYLGKVCAIPVAMIFGGAASTVATQAPVRQPDEHLASQSQHGLVILEGAALEVWASTTGGDLSSPLTGSTSHMQTGRVGVYKMFPSTPQPTAEPATAAATDAADDATKKV